MTQYKIEQDGDYIRISGLDYHTKWWFKLDREHLEDFCQLLNKVYCQGWNEAMDEIHYHTIDYLSHRTDDPAKPTTRPFGIESPDTSNSNTSPPPSDKHL